MHSEAMYFAQSDPDFFDVPWAMRRPTTEPDFAPPAGWRAHRRGPWRVMDPGRPLPPAGWKIHVGSTPAGFADVARAVADVCFDTGTTWKHLADARLVAIGQSTYAPRESSGKTCTVYPTDEAELGAVLTRLRATLRGVAGAAVAGDICDPASPVSARWGAFTPGWVRDADGVPVAAVEGPDGGRVIDDRLRGEAPGPLPACIASLARDAAEAAAQHVLPVREARLLHRTNSGAVYLAVHRGRRVVLKEARAHTGWTVGGSDATTRLRHEYRVLQALSGRGIAPEAVDHLVVGRNEFLVMEYVPGDTLAREIFRRHPAGGHPGASTEPARFGEWATSVVSAVEWLVHRMHALGVHHRDLHPSNVLITDEGRPYIIDFESAELEGACVVRPGGAPGFSFESGGADPDRAALNRLRLMTVNPFVTVLERRPDLVDDLRDAAPADVEFALRGTVPEPGAPSPDATALARGIRAAATPRRDDRLYPGSVEQFTVPGGGTGLWTGAAGVHLALASCGLPVPAARRRWLADRPTAELAQHRGLAFGAEGVALALARTGSADKAADVVRRARRQGLPTADPSWGFGHAGVAVALAELSVLLDDATLAEDTAYAVQATLDAVRSGWAPRRPGLLHGAAGAALALLRCGSAPLPASLRPEIDDAVEALAVAELGACETVGGALLGRSGHRLLPYLGVGSAALGILVHLTDPGGIDLATVRAAAVRSLRGPMMSSGGLSDGRAGVLLALATVAPDDPGVALHRSRASWHVAPRSTPGAPADETYVLAESHLRLSADVATGSAGLLLALAGPAAASAALLLPPSGRKSAAPRPIDDTRQATRVTPSSGAGTRSARILAVPPGVTAL